MPRVLIVNSSARKHSNSNILSARVAAGAAAKGHSVEVVDISRLDIKPCRACEICRSNPRDFCAIDDDMRGLYPGIVAADAIVFVSPIYWFNLCGQIKQFIDRCFAVAVGPDEESSPFADKVLGAVFTYGDADPLMSGCVNAVRSLQDLCAYTGSAWAGAVYGSAYDPGEIETDSALLEAAQIYGETLFTSAPYDIN